MNGVFLLLKFVVILSTYPSGRTVKNVRIASLDRTNDESTCRKSVFSPSNKGDVLRITPQRSSSFGRADSPNQLISRDRLDYVKLNKQRVTVAGKLAKLMNNIVPPTNYRKGFVPKYIRDRQEAQQESENIIAAASCSACPEGQVPLPDDERKETLRMLKKHYREFIAELNMMPIKTDTLRSQKRKMEIEKQLNKLEEGIKVFSRPKVYVKVNE